MILFINVLLAAISYSPNKEIWRIGVTTTTIPRIVFALLYKHTLGKISHNLQYVKHMITVAMAFNLLEIMCLMSLTFIDGDTRILAILHKMSFGGFIIFSMTYFWLQVYLYR